jgi:hypothetical protein
MKVMMLFVMLAVSAISLAGPIPNLTFPVPAQDPVQHGITSYRMTQDALAAGVANRQANEQRAMQLQAMREQAYANARRILTECKYKIKPAASACGNECNPIRRQLYTQKRHFWEFWKETPTVRFLYDKATNTMVDSYGTPVHGKGGAGSLFIQRVNANNKLTDEFIIDYMDDDFTGTEYATDDSYEPLFYAGEATTYLKGRCEAVALN